MDITCILSALLFFTGNLLKLIYLGRERGRDFSWYKFTQLDPQTIQNEWDFRIAHKPQLMATGIISSLAWFIFCFPMLQLVYVLSQKKGPGLARSVWLHSGIVILTLGGAFLEWIASFLYIGSTLACELMIKSFNLQTWTDAGNDYIGIRSLEVAYFAIRGMKFWVDAFEWIALTFIMFFAFVAIRRYRAICHSDDQDPHFGAFWNSLGLFIGILSFFDFLTEVLRTVNFRVFSQIAFWYGSANRLILLPTWLLLLGWRLPYALMDLEKTINHKKNDDDEQQQQPIDLALTEDALVRP